MNWFKRKKRFPVFILAVIVVMTVWHFPTDAEGTESLIETREITGRTDLTANIRKRVEWTNKNTGEGKITLQYASNSGSVTGTKDMNVILIQDKSGSMDSDYGFHIQLEYENLKMSGYQHISYYPIRNPYGWTEAAEEIVEEIVENRNYVMNLNYTGNGFREGYVYNGEAGYNSPCQVDGHYYLLAYDDAVSGNTKATFIHGNNLYNIANTDFHHYIRLDSREEALAYLSDGRRVVRAKQYCDESKILRTAEEYYYFLDVSRLATYYGKQYLSTIDTVCEKNDRLAKSQDFMEKLTENMRNLNKNNRIAYIPFWGDVPQNGSWSNLSANGSNNGLVADTYSPQLSEKTGTGACDFQTEDNFGLILEQIRNSFTYNGTNWSAAFNQALEYLDKREDSEKEKETLIIFLTDGMPQGFSGKASDVNNPAINGVSQIEKLKSMDGVNIYACGVCVNLQDKTVEDRLNRVDSSGTATFARTTNQFDELLSVIEKRIQEEYEETLCGKDAFYTDQLSEFFTLNEEELDSSWSVLDKADTDMVKGVPANVYHAAADNPQVTHIYVKSTKTVYWYVNNMTDGSYDTPGHTFTFSVKYTDYDSSTTGNKKNIYTNQEQKFTYISSANENQVIEVTAEAPCLVFSRQSPVITIEKKLEGSAFKTDQTFYFSCADSRQNYIVKDAVKTASVTVAAGELSGKTILNPVEPGRYYIYETDKDGKIISPEEKCITVGLEKEIVTLEKSSTVPTSVTSSDGFALENFNNYLQIRAVNAEVSFTNSYTFVAGEKVWEDGDSSRRPAAVIVNLYRDGEKIDSAEVSEKTGWKFAFANLPQNDANGRAYDYTVDEEAVESYQSSVDYSIKDGGKYAYITNELLCGNLTVTKRIKSGEEDIWWEHGNPIFVIRVSGKGLDGEKYTFYHTWEFTREYVEANQKDGTAALSYTFENIPLSECYRVEEMCVSRYTLAGVKGNGSNVEVRQRDSKAGDECFAQYANVDLKKKPEGTEVEFYNVKNNYGWYSHNAYVENVIQMSED